jgi:hypothetical protein
MLDAVTRRMALAVTGVVTLITLAASAQAGGGAVPSITFEKDVRPILKTYCFHCHGEEAELKGDLDVRLKRLLEKGGEHGAAITPGSPEKSRLVQMIRAGKMPKTEKKVKPEQLAVIEQWIAAGAPDAAAGAGEAGARQPAHTGGSDLVGVPADRPADAPAGQSRESGEQPDRRVPSGQARGEGVELQPGSGSAHAHPPRLL